MTSLELDRAKMRSVAIRGALIGLLGFTISLTCEAQADARFKDAVLASSSDLTKTCIPAPPAVTPRPGRSPASPTSTDPASCTDIGSTYTLSVGGRLYGIRRSLSDVEQETGLVSLGNSASNISGVLANQMTGTHFMVLPYGNTMRVKFGNRESTYTVVFIR